MVAGDGADGVRTQEFVLAEHSLQDPAQPVLIEQRDHAAFRNAKMPWPRGVQALEEFRHPSRTLGEKRRKVRHSLALPRLYDCGRT